MSNKFNSSSLSEYSKSYARKIAGDFFATHTVISGQELLKLSPIGQVNLFVISTLSEKWRADAERFRSPFFDFENPEVQQALQAFMNTVSQHICMRREHLEPLLADATRKTLTLLFDPRNYFDEALRNQPDFMLTAEAVRNLNRYTQINKFVPTALEERMKGKDFIYVNHALNVLDEIMTQRSRELEKPDKYIAQFSEKVLLDQSVLLRKSAPDYHPQPPLAPVANRSFFETDLENNNSEKAAPTFQPSPVVSETLSSGSSGGALFLGNSSSTEPSSPSMQTSHASTRIETTHHTPDIPSAPQTDDEAPTGPPTIGESFYRAPIESISKSISLNQKFMFINQLFNGNANSYNQAIEELDRASTYDQARDLISYRYAAQYMWDMSSDEVAMLIEILKRRFSL
ncbi:hypothetical protein [Tellurirhabdus bombi]|uniref:hypothetical protein n=1 Tax=Tellurirhabdus bombi TaxID=2907205 RepID=UPI001F15733B|nr:hypothetical protein [Tellurirhabdus bombi]